MPAWARLEYLGKNGSHMTQTESLLFEKFSSAVVRLDAICDAYLQLGKQEALRQAALNQLPFPTFRLTASKKAPVVIKLQDLADHIDSAHAVAKIQWERSQI